MKKLTLIASLAIVALLFNSCGKNDYKKFVGTWGVEKLEYYNIDYNGNPIVASMETYDFVPGDAQSGIDLIFRENKTGEMRDRSRDTIYIKDTSVSPSVVVDTIICPDTTLVKRFTYSFDKSSSILYMNMETTVRTYKMNIMNLESNSFIYENEYMSKTVERAYMKRLSNTVDESTRHQKTVRPHRPGSFLGD